ncbi:MAG: MlaD family protein [Catalinimonas sp.]
MDKKTRNSVLVGVFVSLGAVIFIGALYYLGAQKSLFSSTVDVTATFTDVQGLQAGNNVQFSGIKVGTVREVRLVSDSTVRVTLMIEEDAVPFIKRDATATVGTEGLMGNKVVSIAPGTPGVRSVEAGDELATRQPPSFDELMAVAENTGRNAQQITADLAAIIGQIRRGEGTVGRMLQDSSLYGEIELTLAGYQTTGRNAAALTADLRRVADRVERGEGTVGQWLNDDGTARRVNTLLDSLEQVATAAGEATRNATQFTEKLNDEEGLVNQLLTDTELSRDAHTTVMQVQRTAADFEETAERINDSRLFGWLFKKKKEKDASERNVRQNQFVRVAPTDTVAVPARAE